VNTCSIREHAENKVLSRLGVLRKLKEEGGPELVGVTGCMAQRLGGEFLAKAPWLDLVIGSGAYPRFFEALERRRAGGRAVVDVGYARDFTFEDRPELEPGTVRTFLSIIRGCDNACHYCIVPHTRGPERSKPLPQVVREAQWCAGQGVKEITLLGQNVNHYRWEDNGLAECLRAVARVRGIERVRYTTSHPGYMTDDVLVAMAETPEVMPHLHLPAQSGSDRVLASMNREYTRDTYLRLVDRARGLMPDLALSTDIIVGYPGETEADFRETVGLMERVRYDSAFMFKFSPRRGTVAAGVPDDVPAEEKQRRLAEIIALQRGVTDEASRALVGTEVEVLVDGPSPRNPDRVTGKTRTFRGAVFPGDASLRGRLVRMRVTAARGVTLEGVAVDAVAGAAS
jgi:tRNA-2-methylthio-N6-dimethylallyladenosine synthase